MECSKIKLTKQRKGQTGKGYLISLWATQKEAAGRMQLAGCTLTSLLWEFFKESTLNLYISVWVMIEAWFQTIHEFHLNFQIFFTSSSATNQHYKKMSTLQKKLIGLFERIFSEPCSSAIYGKEYGFLNYRKLWRVKKKSRFRMMS